MATELTPAFGVTVQVLAAWAGSAAKNTAPLIDISMVAVAASARLFSFSISSPRVDIRCGGSNRLRPVDCQLHAGGGDVAIEVSLFHPDPEAASAAGAVIAAVLGRALGSDAVPGLEIARSGRVGALGVAHGD